jgi:hypothetical protein
MAVQFRAAIAYYHFIEELQEVERNGAANKNDWEGLDV